MTLRAGMTNECFWQQERLPFAKEPSVSSSLRMSKRKREEAGRASFVLKKAGA